MRGAGIYMETLKCTCIFTSQNQCWHPYRSHWQATGEMTPFSRLDQLHKYFLNAGGFVCLYGCLVFRFDSDLVYYKRFDSSAKHQNHKSRGLWFELFRLIQLYLQKTIYPSCSFLSFHHSRQFEEGTFTLTSNFWRKQTYRPI